MFEAALRSPQETESPGCTRQQGCIQIDDNVYEKEVKIFIIITSFSIKMILRVKEWWQADTRDVRIQHMC